MSRTFSHLSTLTDGLPVRVEYGVEAHELVGVWVRMRLYNQAHYVWQVLEFNIIENLKDAVLDRLRAECEDALAEEATRRSRIGS